MGVKNTKETVNYEPITARLKKEIMADHGSGKKNTTPTSISLMLVVSPYVDIDGLIQLSKQHIRGLLKIDAHFFSRTLESAKEAGFIEERKGRLYSLVHTFKKSDQFTFIPNYTRLVDGKFPNLGKWAIKLFTYILSTHSSGFYIVNFENLYKNKLHTASNGLTYFPDARRVVNALVKLLEHDLIQIELPVFDNKNRVILDSTNTQDHRAMLETYVEIDSAKDNAAEKCHRKTRTSALKVKKHRLYIKVAPSVTSSKEKVQASRTEISNMLEDNNYSIDLLRENTITSVIGIKNSLFKAAGSVGLSIYRKSLSLFLSQKTPLIDFYEQQEFKVYNHFLNYYILESVQRIILQIAKDVKRNTGKESLSAPIGHFVTAYGTVSTEEVKGLLKFYNERSSHNHVIILEKNLNDLELDLQFFNSTEIPLKGIFMRATDIRNALREDTEVELSEEELIQVTYEAAEKNLLHQKERYENYVKQFIRSQNVFYDFILATDSFTAYQQRIHDEQIAKDTPKKIKFYNWLEVRD